MTDTPAPAWHISEWLNTESPLSLEALRGRVVVAHAFQMLCPGCVQHGVPQAEKLHRMFSGDQAQVVGLHTVFEHHDVMTPAALRVFLHEFGITHPIGVDTPVAGDRIPATMRAYQMQGTPTLMLIDRQGKLRLQHFGRLEDLAVGAEVMRLVMER
jgi:thiol-disulfide isomerase/thioredoxin